jgi:hypothetical protein
MLHAVADHCDLAALLLEPATAAVLRWQDLRDDLVDARFGRDALGGGGLAPDSVSGRSPTSRGAHNPSADGVLRGGLPDPDGRRSRRLERVGAGDEDNSVGEQQ